MTDISSQETQTKLPGETGALSRNTRLGLCLLGLLYALLYIAFWPPIHTTMDESAYLNQAYVFRQGTVYSDVAGISTVQSYPVGPRHHIISQYPPGMGVMLAGASVIGWHTALGANLLVHLICYATLIIVLRRVGLSPWFAGLYLLHPTAIIFSRTTMSDLTSGLLTVSAFLLYLRRQYVIAGIVVGLGVWIRTVGGLALPLLCLGALLDAVYPIAGSGAVTVPALSERLHRGVITVLKIALGAIPLVVGAWLYQKFMQDNGWAKYSGEGLLGLQHFPHQFPQYALQLSVMFPLMLFAPAFYRRAGRGVLISLCYGVLFFYSCYYFQDATGSKLESFVIGLRFILMVLPLFIIAYAAMIEEALRKTGALRGKSRLGTLVAAILALILLTAAAFIHRKHQAFLMQGAVIRDVVAKSLGGTASDGGLLVCNVHVAKLLHPGWSGAHHYVVVGGSTPLDTVAADIESTLRSGKPAYIAFWSRSYRPETPGELKLLHTLMQRFSTENVTPTSGTLSPDVYILRIKPPAIR